jgi:hypothetical protein
LKLVQPQPLEKVETFGLELRRGDSQLHDWSHRPVR